MSDNPTPADAAKPKKPLPRTDKPPSDKTRHKKTDKSDKSERKSSDKTDKSDKKTHKKRVRPTTPTPPPNAPSHFIAPDEVVLTRELGSGNFGQVWLGECRGMTVAVKRLHQQEFDEQVLEEFRKEVGMMVTLTHPNLVLFMGACSIPGHIQIITEYLCYGDLSNVLGDKSINLSFVQKCKMAKDITNAMMWLHNCKPPVIHRDLKPGNLLVCRGTM